MPRGGLRKTVDQHVRDGTYRPDRHGPLPDVADPPAPPPERPADLTGDVAAVWDRLVGLLAGVVRDRDGPLLADLCWLWAELRRVKAAVAKSAPGEKGYNGLLVALGICTDKLDKIAARFGLTPADRAKLKAEAAGPVRARVATRPKTRLDGRGPPK